MLRQVSHRGKLSCSFQPFLLYLFPIPSSLTVFETESIHPCRGNRRDDERPPFTRPAAGPKQIHLVSDVKFACLQDILVRACPTAIPGRTTNLDIGFDQRTTTIVTPREFGALVAGCRVSAMRPTMYKFMFFTVQKQTFR